METLSPPSDHRRPPGHRMDHHPDDPDPRNQLSPVRVYGYRDFLCSGRKENEN